MQTSPGTHFILAYGVTHRAGVTGGATAQTLVALSFQGAGASSMERGNALAVGDGRGAGQLSRRRAEEKVAAAPWCINTWGPVQQTLRLLLHVGVEQPAVDCEQDGTDAQGRSGWLAALFLRCQEPGLAAAW